jgi:predicted RecB family nuclease
MIISSQMFEAHLVCHTKYNLKASGEVGTGNAYTEWARGQTDLHEKKGFLLLKQGLPPEEYLISPPKAGNLKLGKWRLISNLEIHSELLPGLKASNRHPPLLGVKGKRELEASLPPPTHFLTTRIPAVQKITSDRPGAANVQFVSIRFVFEHKVNKLDKLLLAFDSLVLSKILGRKVGIGKIIYGDTHCALNVKIPALVVEVEKIVTNILRLPFGSIPPEPVLNRHCPECEFLDRCRRLAIEKDDLSLLAGMTEQERKKYHGKGIFTVNQLSYTFRPRRRAKRLGDRRGNYHHSLKALAIREKKTYVVGNLDFTLEGTPVYLDIEGLPDCKFYYLIGIRIPHNDSFDRHSLWADSPTDEGKIWTDFLGILSTINDPILIHYGTFESRSIKQMSERHGGISYDSNTTKALNNTLNLLSIIYARVYFPTHSNRLKDIANFLGYEWSEPKASGIQTIIWRKEWEQSGKPYLKEKLILYNQEDCEALIRVVNYLKNLSTSNSQSAGFNSREVINTDTLPRINPFKFQDNQFALPGLHEVNKAAYWNYQQDKILLKSNRRFKRMRKARKRRSQVNLKPNRIIQSPPPSRCPYCSRTRVQKFIRKGKTVLDMQFGRSGIKRWITQYLFYRYYCPGCGSKFLNADRVWTQEKCGPNIEAFSIYLGIYLGLTLGKITAFLNEILGFNFDHHVAYRFKSHSAKSYKNTYERLLGKIVHGSLIHADETKIYLHDTTGYVWVFANLEEVVYVYTSSREGGMVANLLKDFKGVLVSDFYAIYDSLECSQQKCLIHLIRDLNSALMKEPFNDEIKSIVANFASLVKPIIDTVHRFGLKKRYLRKHHTDVRRFFRMVFRQSYKTPTAVKYMTRLEKYRGKLFTFLDYDDVPWNNNNAEHAIKSFVLLRRNFSGFSTEKGMREYLILISICETCKIRGINFLEFLRSGEQDIDAFAEGKFK